MEILSIPRPFVFSILFRKKYIYLFYFKDWEEEHTCKDVCVWGGTNAPARVEVRGQLSGVSSFLPSVHYVQSSAEPSLQTSGKKF